MTSPLEQSREVKDLSIAFESAEIRAKLLDFERPCHVVKVGDRMGVTWEHPSFSNAELLMTIPPSPIEQLGDSDFRNFHGVKYAYAAGAMAGAIASEEMVIALGKEKILSSFGAGGLSPARIKTAIHRIQQVIPQGPYAFNLLHSPSEPALERIPVELYLDYGIRTIEASAFLDLTLNLVHYRAAGLALDSKNEIQINNKVIAKLSRKEVASKFLQPAPIKLLKELANQGLISELQANLATKVPMADDITIEADSGGHTDNRPLVCLFPAIVSLRDEIQQQYNYPKPVRIGAAGGIGTPESALAALMMGAAYVVTGSINQSCIEAGTSAHTKELLAQAEMTEVMMAPAADMFEMGVKLQVLKRGTLFPVRAQKLHEYYRTYDSLEAIPALEREKLEKQIFKKSLDEIWEETVDFFAKRDPEQIIRARNNPKRKMALVFRWYLGLSSRWSSSGEKGREIDYQIWCGPAMGAFNDWVKGSYLAEPKNRNVADVAFQIMTGAAYSYRVRSIEFRGLNLPLSCTQYYPLQSRQIPIRSTLK